LINAMCNIKLTAFCKNKIACILFMEAAIILNWQCISPHNTTHFHLLFAHFTWWIWLNQRSNRLHGPSPGDTPAIDRYVSSFNRSPIAASISNQSAENYPSTDRGDDNGSFIDRSFTQDPLLVPTLPHSPPS
jgi:hypothetical protein